MRLKWLAVAASVLLVAAFAAIAVVHFLDPRSLAVSLAASVKADTGRELSFAEVGVKLLPRPAQVGRATADIDALALLSGRLRIAQISMTDTSVFLETDPDGNGNWVMVSADAGAPAWLKAIEVDELTLQTFAFKYRDGATGRTTSAQLDSARIALPPRCRVRCASVPAGPSVARLWKQPAPSALRRG